MKRKNYWKGKNGPLLIAEIGGNHEGNFNYAKRMAKLAISTGVDAVKFQLYKGSSFVAWFFFRGFHSVFPLGLIDETFINCCMIVLFFCPVFQSLPSQEVGGPGQEKRV